MCGRNITMDEYQLAATNTKQPAKGDMRHNHLFILGLGTEAGEVQDLLLKEQKDGKVINRRTMADELGDVLWYVAMVAYEYDIPLDLIAKQNLEKLGDRYANVGS